MKKNGHQFSWPLPARQRGAVLFIALIMLIVITLLALTASSSSLMQERMVGGMRNQQLGSMGAESALRGSEAWLWNLNFSWTEVDDGAGNITVTGHPLPPCIGGSTGNCVYRPNNDGLPRPAVQAFRTASTWQDALPGAPQYVQTLTGFSGNLETASLAREPAVLIEDMGSNVPPGSGNQSGAIDPENLTAARFYRITARSQGGSAAVVRVMESVFSSSNLTDTGTEP